MNNPASNANTSGAKAAGDLLSKPLAYY